MIALTVYIMGYIVALHIAIIAVMKEFANDAKNGKYYTDEHKANTYCGAIFFPIFWPLAIVGLVFYGFVLLMMKWFKFVYTLVYKEENGTNTP